MGTIVFLVYLITSLLIIYWGFKSLVWEVTSAIYLLVATLIIGISWWFAVIILAIVLIIVAIIHLEAVRDIIADFLFRRAVKSIPKLSKTEEQALNAGDTWLEQDIFRGTPNWQRLDNANTELSAEEQGFLDNETEILCSMLDDWHINQAGDLPEKVWDYIKAKGFFGLVIPKVYGGKGFSARAHSDIVVKVASRSGVAAVTIMVPNSLGPAELLNHYGTEAQKAKYLPKLASGKEIPCFALTEPGAGSDATSIRSEAIVKEKIINGVKTLVLDITLNKRWITLAPVATLIGLAVKLKDPNNLLKEEGTEGITCLLIARNSENLEIGNRHLAAGQPFMNGTIRGKNIIVPIDAIIGGQKNAGHGWHMLVECLSIGRSISLPALGTASSAVSFITSSAFARLRRQFNLEIGQFEGVEEKLAEIAGLSYLINATRLLTVAAVNEDKKPSVASAITKYFNTELARIVVNAAMDVHAGRMVVVGPRNYLATYYASIPICITVEGANIMSRNLLIFGQGSMACHPFIRLEYAAISNNDKTAFRRIIWQHIYYFLHNFAKAVCVAWSGGLFLQVPRSPLRRKYQLLTRLSYAYALVADLSLVYLGGLLKRKERLSARLADSLSYLYLAMAALHYAAKHSSPKGQDYCVKWACDYCFYHAQQAMIAFCQNFPSRFLGLLLRLLAFPFGQTMPYPKDQLTHKLARLSMQNNEYRDALKETIYLGDSANQPIDRMEHALQLLIEHNDLLTKTKGLNYFQTDILYKILIDQVKNGELTEQEMQNLAEVEKARWDALQVDEFAFTAVGEKVFDSLTDQLPNPFDFKPREKVG